MLLTASSCKTSPLVEYRVIKPPSVLLNPCPVADYSIKTNGDLALSFIDLQTKYSICSSKVNSIIYFYDSEQSLGDREVLTISP